MAAKSKLGCQNCRVRHLKCDDAEPACTKCQATGHECIRGYNVRFKHAAESMYGGRLARERSYLTSPSPAESPRNNSKFTWHPDQAWPRTTASGALIFMDETESLTRVYESHDPDAPTTPLGIATSFDGDLGSRISTAASFRRRSSSPRSPTKRSKVYHPPTRVSRSGSGSSAMGREALRSPDARALLDHGGNTTPKPTVEAPGRSRPPISRQYSSPYLQSSSPLPGCTERPAWPLGAVEEARLVRYYVANIANWFDVCDQRRHFATVLPQRAAFCPRLMCAILTVAAHHMSLQNAMDPYIAHRYHRKCLEYLKYVIHDETAVVDENLFAAIIVLRFLEEVDDTDSDSQSHLVGVKALISAHESLPAQAPLSGLRLACYWVAIRQELVISFMHQRQMQWNLARVPIDHRERGAADDDTWANRVVVLCAHVIDFAFDPEGDARVARWRALMDLAESWEQLRPPSFEPIWSAAEGSAFVEPEDGAGRRTSHVYAYGYGGGGAWAGSPRSPPPPLASTGSGPASAALPPLSAEPAEPATTPLPQEWHLSPVHVIARQHLLLAQILLAAHDPTIPRLGPAQRPRLAAADARICACVRLLAGLALSNAATPTNLKTACLGIQMAGERLQHDAERRAVMAVLLRAEAEYRWPTDRARRGLREAWGWM